MNNPNVLEIKQDGNLSAFSAFLYGGLSVNFSPRGLKNRGELTILLAATNDEGVHVPAQSIDINGIPQLCALRDLLDLAIKQHDAKHGVVPVVSEGPLDTAARDRDFFRDVLDHCLVQLPETDEEDRSYQGMPARVEALRQRMETLTSRGFRMAEENTRLAEGLAVAIKDAEEDRRLSHVLQQKLDETRAAYRRRVGVML